MIAGDVLDPDLVTEVEEETVGIEVGAKNVEDADLIQGPNPALDLIHLVNAMAKIRETSANNGLGVTDMFQVRTVPGLMVTMMIYH